MRNLTVLCGVAACIGLAGCSSLLPTVVTVDTSRFDSYAEARDALERTVPYGSTTADLRELGFDVSKSSNLLRVPYPQWVGLLIHPNTPLDRADVGIRDCFDAQEGCVAYWFKFGQLDRERTGGFLLDFFNFHRVTHSYGWKFEGVVLVRDDLVLFRNHGGQPRIELVEDRKNPLGPLQGMGESMPSGMVP
jgi:hypothetical protein